MYNGNEQNTEQLQYTKRITLNLTKQNHYIYFTFKKSLIFGCVSFDTRFLPAKSFVRLNIKS